MLCHDLLDRPVHSCQLVVVARPHLSVPEIEPQSRLEARNLSREELVLDAGAKKLPARLKEPRLLQLP